MTIPRSAPRPACYTFGKPVPSGARWSFDQGASCGNAKTPADWSRLIAASPGCTRGARGLDISVGVISPFPQIDSRTGEPRSSQEVARG